MALSAVFLLLIPLAIAPGLLFHFEVAPKAVLVLLGAAIALLTGSLPINRKVRFLFGAQLLSLGVSTLFSSDPHMSLAGTNWRQFGTVTHAAVIVLAAIGCRPSARKAISIAGWIAAIYGILQYFGVDPLQAPATYLIGEGEWTIVRPPSTLGHADYAGTFYLFGIFAAAQLLRENSQRWFPIAVILTGTAAIALSGTRAAMLGLACGGAVLLLLTRPPLKKIVIASLIATTICAGFYFSPAGEKMRARTRWFVEDASGGSRLMLWRDSVKLAVAHPITGSGPETFSTQFPRFQSRELARAFPDFYSESAHNIFLDAFTSQGVVGLLILLALCAAGLSTAKRKPAIGAGLAAAMTAQMFSVFIIPTALMFYLLVAMLSDDELPWQPPSWIRYAVAAVFLVFAVDSFSVASLLQTTKTQLEQGKFSEADQSYQKATKFPVRGNTAALWYSRTLLENLSKTSTLADRIATTQRLKAAARQAALTSEDRHNAFYNLAMADALINDFPSLEAHLRQAIQVAPNWYKPHWILAKALARAGRIQEAEAEATLAVDLEAGKHPEVSQTLAEIKLNK